LLKKFFDPFFNVILTLDLQGFLFLLFLIS